MKEKIITEQQVRIKTLTAFLIFFLLVAGAAVAWRWLRKLPQEGGPLGGVAKPLRNGLTVNEKLFSAGFSTNRLVKTYPVSAAVKKVRVNGEVGMNPDFDAAAWKLEVVKKNGDTTTFTMDDITKLPKTEIVYDFKCIEGWSQKTWWGGVTFSDFVKHYGLENEAQLRYVGMMTPDKEYYVGIDRPGIMHAQTLLCYEMNGKPLPMNQGYPLRLIIPVKYGIKSIKRIGTIFFSDERPRDYWAERGYDYYAGH
jgi:DMSO/TMAO reductase YedYZ molybdopterin-dependent catalytic subunit